MDIYQAQRWIIGLGHNTQAESLADENVTLCVTSGRTFQHLSSRLLGGE